MPVDPAQTIEEPDPEPDDPSTAPSATGAPDAGDDAGATIVTEAPGAHSMK